MSYLLSIILEPVYEDFLHLLNSVSSTTSSIWTNELEASHWGRKLKAILTAMGFATVEKGKPNGIPVTEDKPEIEEEDADENTEPQIFHTYNEGGKNIDRKKDKKMTAEMHLAPRTF